MKVELGRVRVLVAEIYSKERQRLEGAKEKGELASSKIAFTDDNDMNGQIEELKDREGMLTNPKVAENGKRKVKKGKGKAADEQE